MLKHTTSLFSERAKRAKLTISRVQLRFQIYIILLASERSERDTYRGNTIKNRGCLFIYLFIYMFGRMYVILYFDPPYFCVRSAFDLVPVFTKQNPPV